jgi:putative heme-binding domain-containing protein
LPPAALVAAIEALGNLRARTAVRPLVGRLHDSQTPVRQAAVAALALVGGKEATGEVMALLDDPKIEIRRAAILALGSLKAREAIPQLLRCGIKKETRFEVTQALAEMPDARALDLYLEGLGGRNNKLRASCSQAVAVLGVDVLPEIESRLDATLLGPDAVSELQQIFSRRQPTTNWKLLGPFASPVGEPFPVGQVPLDAEFRSSQGKKICWVPARLSPKLPGHVNLARQMSVQSDATAFAVAELHSPANREVEFVAGSDDSFTLWLNGEKIFEAPGNRAYRADEFQPRGRLRAGTNVLLAKIGQGSGGWEFSVACLAPRESRLFQIVPKKLDPAAYAQFAVKTPGHADRGRELFADLKGAACTKCHRVRGEGGDVGPDLLGVGAKYNRQQLIEAVLYPSKQILDGYRQTAIVTDEGAVLTGIVRGETDEVVNLVDAEGKKHALAKDRIDQREEGNCSVMPDGLNSGLSLADFSDIVSYLESLKEKPATAATP